MLVQSATPVMLPKLLAALTLAASALAQDELALRKFFEGKNVTVKLDMPGDNSGIDIHPGAELPVEFPIVAKRLRRYGVSLRNGDSVTVTQIKVKEKAIEFQLGGGGFGSFGDMWSLPSVPSTSRTESSEERSLKREISRTTDPKRRRSLESQLDSARRRRYREHERNVDRAEIAKVERSRVEQSRRESSGSRFNIRFANGVPPGALTPNGLMSILTDYVEFSFLPR